MPAATCVLEVPSDSESQITGMARDGMKSVAPVLVDVRVAGPCIEPRDDFSDLKSFFKMRFISLST